MRLVKFGSGEIECCIRKSMVFDANYKNSLTSTHVHGGNPRRTLETGELLRGVGSESGDYPSF